MIHMDSDASKQKTNGDHLPDDGDVPEPIRVRRSLLSRDAAYGLIRDYYAYFLPGVSIVFYIILLASKG